MTEHRLEVADVVREHQEEFLARWGHTVSPQQHKALRDIGACRTSALGGRNLTASGVPYADYTGYVPLNPPSTVPVNPATVLDVNHWQPLQYFDATGTFVTPKYIGPFWGNVTPFALTSGDQFRPLIAQA